MLKAHELTKIYTGQETSTVALSGVSLEVEQGEFVAIMGPSGCGKSTLLHLFGLLDTPTSGQLFFRGQEISTLGTRTRTLIRRRYIGFVFQYFNLIEELTIYENIELPLIYGGVALRERKIRVQAVMERASIWHKRSFFPRQLSGGQQQRVALCRAVVHEPELLLADEPTGNLDSLQGQEVLAFLSELHEQGMTIVLVTHSKTIASYAQRIIQVFDGQIVTGAIISD